MTDAKRGRGLRHGVYLPAVAALGFALSGCGGGGSSAATASTAQSSAPPQGSTSTQGSTPTGSSPPAPGTSTGSGTTAGSAGSGSNGGSPTTPSAANVTVNWIPPTENTDGTTLTNLAGYNIHYGTASHNYTRTISVTNPGLASYVVESLTPGKYYFAVAAVNSAGTESPLSSEASATVD
jgi:fibronectin type III domain protein